MRYLLDTHAFLWWMADDPQLSKTARSMIQDGDNDVIFSAVTAWEIAIKSQMGRFKFYGEPFEWLPRAIERSQFATLSVDLRHALYVAKLPLIHRDPFDRLLIAQALVEGFTIVTSDGVIARYSAPTIW